jgi:hypothetical protein
MSDRASRSGAARRAVRLLRSKLHADLYGRLDQQNENIDEVRLRLGALHDELARMRARVDAIEADARRTSEISRHIYDEEPANRRRLHELRRSPEYEPAFTEAEPLVSFLIPTYRSFETLRDVAIPSILGQSYANVEVVVVGDCAPPETAQAIVEIDDARVVYVNRAIRGPYPEDPARRWYAIGVPPFNEALSIARGRWIAVLGDDDAVRPNHTEVLLAAARERRLEHVYGRQQVNFAEGGPMVIGEFPPALGQWGLQAALYHSGLRYFESELSDAIYEEPADWSKCRRMVRAGVRFGMVEEIVVDKHEHRRRSAEEWRKGGIPLVD